MLAYFEAYWILVFLDASIPAFIIASFSERILTIAGLVILKACSIPKEDSPSFEFDDTNVFSSNRFPGLDRIEGGPRVNFGFKYGIYGNNGGTINLLLGQVFRLKADDTFAERT